jgi:AAA+ superfamily predicted ATPase
MHAAVCSLKNIFYFHTTMNATENRLCIQQELAWLANRIDNLLNKETEIPLPLPTLNPDTAFGKLIIDYELADEERILFSLAFASMYQPSKISLFGAVFNQPQKKAYFGGVFTEEDGQFFPTVRTAIFLLAGNDEEMMDYYISYFNNKNKVFTSNLILTDVREKNQTFLNQQIIFNDQFLPSALHGLPATLDGGNGFPAKRSKRIHTMSEVILDEKTMTELQKLNRFARNMKALWSLPNSSKYRQNFIGIFSGDPGTGKSHTAEAMGNELNLPVYKVNFAQLVSKYIGETEKNLERVFDRFSGQPNILFFDEAESIFSKRMEVKDSHDKHSNNEQSFLLQKIEEYNGIVILATNVQNLSNYFDKAFQRRIRQIVTFSFPEHTERQRLWENAIAAPFHYAEGLLERLAKNYQFSGGGIYNIISEGVIEALDQQTTVITFELLEQAMKDEFKKTGRRYEVCTDEQVMQDAVKRYGPGYEQRRNF